MKLFEIITALQTTQGNNAKKAILEANQDNMLLKEYLRVTYDPRINFYVTEKTLPDADEKHDLILDDFSIEDIKILVDNIANRKYTGHDAKRYLSLFFSELNPEGEALAQWLLLKDIKAGISVSTINKVWPSLIFEQPYMRCSLQKDVDLSKWDWLAGVYSQTKMDGMYAAVNSKQVITRNGSVLPYDLLPVDFKQDMKQIPEGFELNGELLVYKDGKYLSRKEGNGILNSLLQGQVLPEGCNLQYIIWDYECGLPYIERFTKVDTLCVNSQTFKVVDTRFVFSMEEAHKHFTDILAQGGEGTILKNPKGMWKDGTSKDQVKYKLECEIDLLCTGWIEGEGKYKGKIGALQCQSSDGKLKVNVGSGFTDKEREQEPPVNKIITVKANDIVDKRDSDVYSLFLPIYVETRLDKSEADSFERIKSIFDSAKGLINE